MYNTCYSCQISIKLEYSRKIFGETQIQNFRKIRPVGAECNVRKDGRTDKQPDMAKLKFAFVILLTRLKTE